MKYKFIDLEQAISAAIRGELVYVIDFSCMAVNNMADLTIGDLPFIDNPSCICVIEEK